MAFKSDKQRKGFYARNKKPSKLSKIKANKKIKAERKFNIVMKEYADGKLKSASGDKVTNRKQALAIAYSEARQVDPNYGYHSYSGANRGTNKEDVDISSKELQAGIKTESEHKGTYKKYAKKGVTAREFQESIAKEHEQELIDEGKKPEYYKKLKKCGL